jgi:hypothetical protein
MLRKYPFRRAGRQSTSPFVFQRMDFCQFSSRSRPVALTQRFGQFILTEGAIFLDLLSWLVIVPRES